MLGDAEYAALREDIRQYGQRDPCWTWRGKLLDGRNRARACAELGLSLASRDFDGDELAALRLVISTNVHRRHLTPGQRDAVGAAVEPMFAAELARAEAARKAAQAREQPRDERGRVLPRTKADPPDSGVRAAPAPQARDLAAQAVGASPRGIQRFKELEAKAPEAAARVRAGEMPINKALGEIKLAAKHKLAAELRAAPLPPTRARFGVIAIDPPWQYEKRAEDTTHRGRNQYPDMHVNEIKALPIALGAEPDCVLWLWTTNAFMREAFECLDAWGFSQKTILTWAKDRMGVGDWLRGQTEHCILAVRGKPIVTLTNQTTLLHAPLREHSRKPDEFYALVEALCPGSKVEMFARERRKGWQAWGAEVGKFG